MKKIFCTMIMAFIATAIYAFPITSEEEVKALGATDEALAAMKNDPIQGVKGSVMLTECNASIEVPEGFSFIDKDETKKLLVDYWNNPENRMEGVLGALVPDNATYYYQLTVVYVISYDNCGYISDEDANSVDYDEILESMQDEAEKENAKLPEEQRMSILGWAESPRYELNSHALVWAKKLSSVSGIVINYDMRFLGKDGYISVNAVISESDLLEVESKKQLIIDALQFDKGYTYADYDASKDKVSDWTLGGLVAGGVLAKTGLLSKIGLFLAKAWKLIAIAVVAAIGGIAKFFKRNKEE